MDALYVIDLIADSGILAPYSPCVSGQQCKRRLVFFAALPAAIHGNKHHWLYRWNTFGVSRSIAGRWLISLALP